MSNEIFDKMLNKGLKIFILCGGSGTRLWPLSRECFPKQFVPLFDNSTLFLETLKRSKALLEKIGGGEIHVVTSKEYYFLVQQEARALHIPIASYLLEDQSRDTAGAMILSALHCRENDLMLMLPSDHLIRDFEGFASSVVEALLLAREGKIVTFGITPACAHTGYGYIHAKGREVLGFREKPSLQKAQEYVQSQEYFWNSGMFCFQSKSLLQECSIHAPELLMQASKVYAQAFFENHYVWFKNMDLISKISIDYALMEKSQNIAMVEGDFVWNDVGSFDSLSEEFDADCYGNRGNAEIYTHEARNNFILSSKPVVAIGVENLTLVDTKDALLVVSNGRTQEVKSVVDTLKQRSHPCTLTHPLTYRPWGSYEVLEESLNYKIKKIIVFPHKRLSLQKHYHRNEHWVVLSGCARVRIGEEEILLQANQSTYIPMGSLHRLENPSPTDPLVLIEVQVGDYVGEDDIVRIEDDFHRVE